MGHSSSRRASSQEQAEAARPDAGGTRLNRRAFFAVGGSLAAAGLLAACGGNTGRGDASTTSQPGTAAGGAGTSGAGTSGPAASGAGTGGSKPTLQQWYHQYGEEGTEAAVKRYAASYPNATVEVSWFPGDYESKAASALLTSSPPDVFEGANGPTIDQIQQGLVADLTDLLGDAKSDFNPAMLERMSYDGKVWGIPETIDMQLLVYRKSLLDKAGVKPPTSFEELRAAAKALTQGKQKGLFVGNDGGVGTLVGPSLWSVGEDYVTDGKVGFTPEQAGPALAGLHTLFTSGNLLLGAPTDWSDPSALTNGLCAMQWTGLWNFPQFQKALGDDFGVAAWPAFAAGAGKPSVPIGAYGSCVAAKGANVDAAKAFVKWLWVDNTADQLDFAQSYGFHLPSRESVAAKADKLKSGQAAEALKIFQTDGHAQTPMLWTSKSSTAMSDAATRIIKDGADAKAELAKVVATVEAELKRVTAK
ncbi:extracellular solute-binding protein [Nakamurella sp. DB0629]|uniref:Extracellular solute-binding protein n=2 Tax=Nakamurella aerolata TaxID=1656892 RepID=A0A849A147_9ACTN|nr:extracellular solute-binding protein [Nakamurella aerolata]